MFGDQEARGRMEFFALKEPVKSPSFRGRMEVSSWPSVVQLYRGNSRLIDRLLCGDPPDGASPISSGRPGRSRPS